MALTTLRPIRSNLTSVDPRNVPKGFASRSNNLRHEDGSARWRLGYRSILGVPGVGIASQKLFAYSKGRNAGTNYDGYIVVEGPVGTVKPYVVDPTTGTRSLLRTAALSHPTFNDSYWRHLVFDAIGYLVNPDDSTSPLWKYTVQSFGAANNTLTALTPPAAPTTAVTIAYDLNDSSATKYTELPFTGLAAAGPTYVAPCVQTFGGNPSALVGQQWKQQHNNTTGRGSFEIDTVADLTLAAVRDWQNKDVVAGRVSIPTPASLHIDAGSLKLYARESGGTEVQLNVETRTNVDTSGRPTTIDYHATFPQGKTRATWVDVQYLRWEYDVIASDGSAAAVAYFSPLTEGGVYDWPDLGFQIGYQYYNSTDGLGSGIGGVVDTATAIFGRPFPNPVLDSKMGTVPLLTLAGSSDASVDKIRVFVRKRVPNDTRDRERKYTEWRQLTEISDPAGATTTMRLAMTDAEFEALSEQTTGNFTTTGLLGGRVYRDWVVWFYRDGTIAHSRVGEPTKLATLFDRDEDESRGTTFTARGDSFDEIRDYHQAGGNGIALTLNGVYIQRDTTGKPSGMLPPVRQSGAPGCAGFNASCRYRSETGVPGVAYVTQDVSSPSCSVMFLQVDESADADSSFTIHELTRDVRGLIFTHLFESNTTVNAERLNLFVDPRSGALCLLYVDRMMVLRRPNVIDGEREWECYKFTVDTDTWILVAPSADRGIRVRRQGGQLDELFYDSSSNFAEITGSTMDGGSAAPTDSAYWTATDLTGPWRRAVRAYLDRTPTTQAFKCKVFTDRQDEESTVAANKENCRYGAKTSGRNHKLKVTFPADTTAVLHGIEYETEIIGQRRGS